MRRAKMMLGACESPTENRICAEVETSEEVSLSQWIQDDNKTDKSPENIKTDLFRQMTKNFNFRKKNSKKN